MSEKIKILLVEDDKAILQMYRLKFDAAGIDVIYATDGHEGYKFARKHKPQLILLDLRMPKMTGDVLLEKLQKEPWIKQTQIVIMSNVNESEAPKLLKAIGYDDYLIKAHLTPRKIINIVKKKIAEIQANPDKSI